MALLVAFGGGWAGVKVRRLRCRIATSIEKGVVEYVWPRPGETEPSPKASYITKAGGQICGVGYYQ